MKMKLHVVAQGEYLAKIAYRYGVEPDAVWNNAKNAELKAKRPDPDILCPGDLLFVPDVPSKGVPLKIGVTNRYVARVPMAKVDLLFTRDGKPFANEPFEVVDRGITGVSDERGHVQFEIPVTARAVQVRLTSHDWTRTVLVGDLDPIDEASGVRMRLEHLGYGDWLLAEGNDTLEDDASGPELVALAAFQRDQKLPQTGTLDAATRAALARAHEGTA